MRGLAVQNYDRDSRRFGNEEAEAEVNVVGEMIIGVTHHDN